MKVSVFSCAITFVVGWLIGCFCIFLLLTSIDHNQDSRFDMSHSHQSMTLHEIMKRERNFDGMMKNALGSEFKSLGFSEQQSSYSQTATVPPISSFDKINQLFKSYHFPFISSSSLSSSWIFHTFSHRAYSGDDDNERDSPNSNVDDKFFIFLDWPVADDHFTIHNYHSLQTLLATFPQAIVRCLLPVPSSLRVHSEEKVSRSQTWDEEHDRQKYPAILAKRQFELYRKLGYDIDTVGTMDISNKIFRLFTFGQSYRKKWFSAYRKTLFQRSKVESHSDDASRTHFSHNDDEREDLDQNQRQVRRDEEARNETPKDETKDPSALPPYHLLTYIRLAYLWKKGGIFMDFSFLFRRNPFHIPELSQGYYINSYCSNEKKLTDSTTAVYRPKSYDSWRDLECYTSTLFLFRNPHDDLLACVLKKYDDEIFQVCIESDPFYGGAECILRAFHQCTDEAGSSYAQARGETSSKGHRRHYFGKTRLLLERFHDDPLTAKQTLMKDMVDRESSERYQGTDQNGSGLIVDAKEVHIGSVQILNFSSSAVDLKSDTTPMPSKHVESSQQQHLDLSFNIDKVSILWMGHLAWQGTWVDYPYPTYSALDLFVQPAKAITHHHLKFLRRKIRLVEETFQQQIIDGSLGQQQTQNKNMSGIVITRRNQASLMSSSLYQPKSCHPFATSLTLPVSDIPETTTTTALHRQARNMFTASIYDPQTLVREETSNSSIPVIGSNHGTTGTNHENLSQHLRGSRMISTPSHSPSVSPSNKLSVVIDGGNDILHDQLECSPSIYMVGFKDTGSEIIRKLLDGNPFILAGWSSETQSKSMQPASRLHKEPTGSVIETIGQESGHETTASAITLMKERWPTTDHQLLGILSSFVVEEQIGCYSTASVHQSNRQLNSRSQCFPFIEPSLPVAENYNGSNSEWIHTIPSSSQKSIDKYSPASIFHMMDGTLTYNMDPVTPFVIKQDNPNAKALFVISNPIERMVRTFYKHRTDLQFFLNQHSDDASQLSNISLDDMILLLIEKSKTGISHYRKLLLTQQQQSQHDKMDVWLERYFELVYSPLRTNHTLSFFEELLYHSIYFPAITHYTRVLGMQNMIVVDIDDLVHREFFTNLQKERMSVSFKRENIGEKQSSPVANIQNTTTFFQDIFDTDVLRSLYVRIGVPYAEPAANSHFFKTLLLDMEREFVLFDGPVNEDSKFTPSRDVYRKLVTFFMPFVEVLEQELGLNLTHWKTPEDGAYYSHLPELSYGWNSTRPLLWFETGYNGSEEDDETEEPTGKILPHLLPQRTTEEDNGFNTTLGMLNTF